MNLLSVVRITSNVVLKYSSTIPKRKQMWTRCSLNLKSINADMSNLFDQIIHDLGTSGTLNQQGSSRRSDQFIVPLHKADVATNAEPDANNASASATLAQPLASQSLDGVGVADRSVKSPSSLMASGSASSHESSYSKPKVGPVEAPSKFDSQTFTFGSSTNSSASAFQSLKRAATSSDQEYVSTAFNNDAQKTAHEESNLRQNITNTNTRRQEYLTRKVSLPVDEANKKSSAKKAEGSARSGPQENVPRLTLSSFNTDGDPLSFSSQEQAGKCTVYGEKRKAFKSDIKKNSNNHYSTCDFEMYSLHPGYAAFEKKCTKKEMDDLVAFADKWMPDSKKRRVDEKK